METRTEARGAAVLIGVTLIGLGVSRILTVEAQTPATAGTPTWQIVTAWGSVACGMLAVMWFFRDLSKKPAAPMDATKKPGSIVNQSSIAKEIRYRLRMRFPFAWTVIVPEPTVTTGELRWGLRFENSGTIPLMFQVETIFGIMNGHGINGSGNPHSIISPGEEQTVWGPTVSDFPANPDEITGQLTYSLLYGDPDHFPQFRLRHSFTFSRNKNLEGNFLMASHNVEGPHHEPLNPH